VLQNATIFTEQCHQVVAGVIGLRGYVLPFLLSILERSCNSFLRKVGRMAMGGTVAQLGHVLGHQRWQRAQVAHNASRSHAPGLDGTCVVAGVSLGY
jgi:hypothetical protein